MAIKTWDLSDKRAFLSDNSKNNLFFCFAIQEFSLPLHPVTVFSEKNGNDCLTKNLLQILNDYFVCLVDS